MKKIKDLTLEELVKLCERSLCNRCPFVNSYKENDRPCPCFREMNKYYLNKDTSVVDELNDKKATEMWEALA